MPPEEKPQDSTLNKIAASSVALSDCAASIRSRLQAQRDTLDRLRAGLAEMRTIAGIPSVETQALSAAAAHAPPPIEAPVQEHPAPPAFEVHRFPVVETPAPEIAAAPFPLAADPRAESLDAALDQLVSPTFPSHEAAPQPPADPLKDLVAPPETPANTESPAETGKTGVEPDVESFETIIAKIESLSPSAADGDADPIAQQPVLTPLFAAAPAVPEPAALDPIAESTGEPTLTPLFSAKPVLREAVAAPVAAPPSIDVPIIESIVESIVPAPVAAPLPAYPSADEKTVVIAPVVPEPVVSETVVPEAVIAPPLADAPADEKTVIIPPVAPEPVVFEPLVSEPVQPQSSHVVLRVPRRLLLTALPVVCLIGAFFALARFQAPARPARPKAAPLPPPAAETSVVDAKASEALALVQHWRMAGDDKSVFERLGGVVEHPGGVPAWSAEMTDDDSYLVVFREVAGTPVYAFETNLKSKTVQPTPEAVDRLTLIRVRDAASAKLNAR